MIKLGVYISLLLFIVVIWFSSLGLPKPTTIENFQGKIISYEFREPKAIYLWILVDGMKYPLSYRLPWNEKNAADIRHQMKKAKQNHETTEIVVRNGNIGPTGTQRRGTNQGYIVRIKPNFIPNKS